MWLLKVVFCLVFLFFPQVRNIPKTYYFSINKTTNEYMIRSRTDPSYSGHNYQAGVHLSELRNNITRKRNSSEVHTHPLLDPEWDYNWKNITRRKLPTYITKYYETFSKNITASVRFVFNAKSQNSTLLRFNLSDINENISEAGLHFYHRVDKDLLKESLILRLYEMENDYVNASSLINPDSHKLLNVIYIFQAESGWQIFKLTNTLLEWSKNKTDVLLFITISKPNEEQFSFFKDANSSALRTFLFLKSEPLETRNIQNEIATDSSLCRKQDLYVDFEKLNWMKFTISPSGYHAFTCYGTCYRNHNLPNHAKITSFRPEIARKSLCCTPVDYLPLSIMFYDKNGNVIIKIYDDMIISACGCR